MNSQVEAGSNRPADGLPDTIGENLSVYNIGAKVKRLRHNKSMGLAELGRHTSLSAAMLSKIENDRVVPTLQTLVRIALVFSVGLDYFFTESAPRLLAVVRKNERIRFPEDLDKQNPVYYFECLDFKSTNRASSAYLADFTDESKTTDPIHQHDGREFLYVLSGTLGLKVDNEETELAAGDAAYFDGSYEHRYRKIGTGDCRALILTIP